jgi:uncharacterized protein YdhG (YjbR/CyaY superfamily)
MASAPALTSVDEYLAGFPPGTRRMLEELRAIINEAVPGLTERISYRMPAFELGGRPVIYIAGYPGHVGMYPLIDAVGEEFEEELRPFKHGRGTARFPLDQPLPADLIRRVVLARAAEVAKLRK